MKRREALSATAALLGGTLVGAQAFLAGCSHKAEKISAFNETIVAFLDELGESIIPTTPSSPGARAAAIGDFMKVIVTDCYSPSEQAAFFEGIATIKNLCHEKFGRDFSDLDEDQKHDFLLTLDKESRAYEKENEKTETPHFFSMIKQLTIWGYFSSEPGATTALRFVSIPGRYDACIDYTSGDGAWLY